jgi:hypothetical protein
MRMQIYFAVVVATIILTGCNQRKDAATDERKKQDATLKQLNALARTYFDGNAGEARDSLVRTVQLIEDSDFPVVVRAGICSVAYSRLYVLDKRTGNPLLAESALVKARYWHLRDAESARGESEANAAKGIIAMTPAKCEEFVDQHDRNLNNGRRPAYVAALPALRPSTAPDSPSAKAPE